MEEEKEIIIYTLILHQARKKLRISTLEYCVADTVYHLANNPNSEIKGWCYAAKETIAGFLNISPRGAWKIIDRLIGWKLVERNKDDRRYLRTTEKWYKNVVLLKLQIRGDSSYNRNKVPIKQEQSSGSQQEQSSRNKDNTNKDNINTIKNLKKLKTIKAPLKKKMFIPGSGRI